MSSKSTTERNKRVQATVLKYAKLRMQLKKDGDYAALHRLPRDAPSEQNRTIDDRARLGAMILHQMGGRGSRRAKRGWSGSGGALPCRPNRLRVIVHGHISVRITTGPGQQNLPVHRRPEGSYNLKVCGSEAEALEPASAKGGERMGGRSRTSALSHWWAPGRVPAGNSTKICHRK